MTFFNKSKNSPKIKIESLTLALEGSLSEDFDENLYTHLFGDYIDKKDETASVITLRPSEKKENTSKLTAQERFLAAQNFFLEFDDLKIYKKNQVPAKELMGEEAYTKLLLVQKTASENYRSELKKLDPKRPSEENVANLRKHAELIKGTMLIIKVDSLFPDNQRKSHTVIYATSEPLFHELLKIFPPEKNIHVLPLYFDDSRKLLKVRAMLENVVKLPPNEVSTMKSALQKK